MADKGLVSKSTLQGFADEVRRLAESEQTGTPAEMLALLQAVEAGLPLPGWITEIDFVTITPASSSASLEFPTILTKKPTNMLVFTNTYYSNSSVEKAEILFQTMDSNNCRGVLRCRNMTSSPPSVFMNSSSSSPVASANFSSSKSTVTITNASGTYFTKEYEYKVIVWW